MHLSHKADRMESGIYSVVCSLCIVVFAVYFLTWRHFIKLGTDTV